MSPDRSLSLMFLYYPLCVHAGGPLWLVCGRVHECAGPCFKYRISDEHKTLWCAVTRSEHGVCTLESICESAFAHRAVLNVVIATVGSPRVSWIKGWAGL